MTLSLLTTLQGPTPNTTDMYAVLPAGGIVRALPSLFFFGDPQTPLLPLSTSQMPCLISFRSPCPSIPKPCPGPLTV